MRIYIFFLYFGAVFFSVFQDMYLFTLKIDGFHRNISPYWIFLILIDLTFVYNLLILKKTKLFVKTITERTELKFALIAVSVFVVYSVFSASILPFAFKGIGVLSPPKGMDAQFHNPSHLKFYAGNAGQALYIILNFMFVLATILFSKEYKNLFKIFIATIVLAGLSASLFGLFQLISSSYNNHLFLLLYKIFHNNSLYAHCSPFIGRVFSTFTEPSFFAGFISSIAILAESYIFINTRYTVIFLLLFLLSFVILIFTFSPTGYIPFVVATALLFLRLSRENRKKTIVFLFFLAITLCISFLLLKETPIQSHSAWDRFVSTVIYKYKSGSFKVRIWSDIFSYKMLFKTYLLGSGLGSNRPSSFLAYVASNLGIVGIFSLITALYFLIRYYLKHRNSRLTPVFYASSTYFLAALIAIPDPNWPPFLWIYLALFLAVAVRCEDLSKGEKESGTQRRHCIGDNTNI